MSVLALWAVAAFWLLRFPPSLSSDDALYFAHGLTRFSILDFSPHFPGYPVFIALGRLALLFVLDPVAALGYLTIVVALTLPPMAAWVAWRWTAGFWSTLAAFSLTLSQPLLAGLALSGMSDGTGLLFFLLFLAVATLPNSAITQHPSQGITEISPIRAILGGVVLALCLWARPSYAPMVFAALLMALLRSYRTFVFLCIGGLTLTVPVLLFLFANEGLGYLREGHRFFTGHVFVWGNTTLSGQSRNSSWVQTFEQFPALAGLLFVYTIGVVISVSRLSGKISRDLALASFLIILIWTGTMQNPENLRHLAPVLFLGGLISATLIRSTPVRTFLVLSALTLNGWLIVRSYDFRSTTPSPLESVSDFMNAELSEDAILMTRHGAAYLRQNLNLVRTYDLLYKQSVTAAFAANPGQSYRLSTTPLAACLPVAEFPGRVLSEPDFYLYRLDQACPLTWR